MMNYSILLSIIDYKYITTRSIYDMCEPVICNPFPKLKLCYTTGYKRRPSTWFHSFFFHSSWFINWGCSKKFSLSTLPDYLCSALHVPSHPINSKLLFRPARWAVISAQQHFKSEYFQSSKIPLSEFLRAKTKNHCHQNGDQSWTVK